MESGMPLLLRELYAIHRGSQEKILVCIFRAQEHALDRAAPPTYHTTPSSPGQDIHLFPRYSRVHNTRTSSTHSRILFLFTIESTAYLSETQPSPQPAPLIAGAHTRRNGQEPHRTMHTNLTRPTTIRSTPLKSSRSEPAC